MTKTFSILVFAAFCFFQAFSQTQKDTIYANISKTPVIVDGSDSDSVWATAKWYNIDQVWIPYDSIMKEGDFQGRYKVAWDTNFLYLLVEVVDDSLSDDHKNPLDSWWEDDCVEIFIDEDRSKGDHQCNFNAFAYHVSFSYDAIDMNSNCQGINLKNNLSAVMDTIADNTYLWEFAIKMYNKNFIASNPEASRVMLTPNKLMGLSIAYCDNDETTGRENFIGSMYMTKATANDSYKNADYFGSLLLVDPDYVSTSIKETSNKKFNLNSSNNLVTITQKDGYYNGSWLEVHSLTGALVTKVLIENAQTEIDTNHWAKGVYVFKFTAGSFTQSELVLKQ